MSKIVLLNNIDHQDLRVGVMRGAAFGDSVNQVLVVPTEFQELQREYPIFLRRDNNEIKAVALLGLDPGENLYLDGNDWNARYIPAIQARGPFSIGLQKSEQAGEEQVEAKINIDMDHPSVGKDEGYPLFLPEGGNAPYLEHVSAILRLLHDGVNLQNDFYNTLDEMGLIEDIVMKVDVNPTVSYDMPGFLTVGLDKLRNLDGTNLEKLSRSGYLHLTYLLASSTSNINRLIEMKNRKIQAAELNTATS